MPALVPPSLPNCSLCALWGSSSCQPWSSPTTTSETTVWPPQPPSPPQASPPGTPEARSSQALGAKGGLVPHTPGCRTTPSPSSYHTGLPTSVPTTPQTFTLGSPQRLTLIFLSCSRGPQTQPAERTQWALLRRPGESWLASLAGQECGEQPGHSGLFWDPRTLSCWLSAFLQLLCAPTSSPLPQAHPSAGCQRLGPAG